MILKKDNLNFHILLDSTPENEKLIPLIFLHGFTGGAADWQVHIPAFRNICLPGAIDLIGHGFSSSPEEPEHYTAEAIVSHLDFIFNRLNFKEVILAGYSMGGRAALSYAAKRPHKIKGLILESATPGIIAPKERKERVGNDRALANRIKENGLYEFITAWQNHPLFASQKNVDKNILEEINSMKLKNNPYGLINSLLEFGTGKMPSLWDKLENLNVKTLLITGEYDKKFTEINSKANLILPHCEHIIVKSAGHNVHLEKPDEFIILISRFINNLNEPKSL